MLSNMAKRFGKGFTLIELMIVVAIIGVLAAIAVPNFVKFQCRSKQSEAKTNLKALYVSEEGYRGEFDRYWVVPTTGAGGINTNAIGFQPKGERIRYDYQTSVADTLLFTASAVGTADVVGDQWQMTQANALNNISNTCN